MKYFKAGNKDKINRDMFIDDNIERAFNRIQLILKFDHRNAESIEKIEEAQKKYGLLFDDFEWVKIAEFGSEVKLKCVESYLRKKGVGDEK